MTKSTTFSTRPKRVKFVTNKELLAEIHRCKRTFCSFTEPRYADFDVIVTSPLSLNAEHLTSELERINTKLAKGEEPKTLDGLVVRFMTHDHVPLDPERKRKSRVTNENHARTNFPPFKHYLVGVSDDGELSYTEVCRSHWVGDFETGHFSVEGGRMTERMGRMFQLLVERYGNRGNWRSYSYREDMEGLALMHLAQVGLQFDESKSNNPFSFYTTTMQHCFTRTFNVEKKVQSIRDDLLIQNGMSPSITRQIDDELAQKGLIPKKLQAKRGRKTATQVAAEKKEREENDS